MKKYIFIFWFAAVVFGGIPASLLASDDVPSNIKGTVIKMVALNYSVQYERALVTAQLNDAAGQAGAAGAGGDGQQKPDDKPDPKNAVVQGPGNSSGTNLKKEIITGPKEHWFMAADVRLKSADQIKYDNTTRSLQTRDSPNAFYFSFNYMFGDVYADKPLHWWDSVLVKALLEASKSPYDAFGLGIGWRQPEIGFLGLSFETVSPFAGFVWTRSDSLSDGIVKTESRYGKPAFIWGLSFNLDVAARWLGRSEKNKADGNAKQN